MAYNPEYYQRNRERELARHKAYNKTHSERLKVVAKDWRLKNRLTCLEHYGGTPPQCACCAEPTLQFLSIDHVNGGGSQHRKALFGGGGNIYAWLIKQNFPAGFQVLCHNCNLAKGFYGSCPHNP
jgi:hypothetical protein